MRRASVLHADPNPDSTEADESAPVQAVGFVMTLIALVTICWVTLGALTVAGVLEVPTALAVAGAGYAAAAALVFVAARIG